MDIERASTNFSVVLLLMSRDEEEGIKTWRMSLNASKEVRKDEDDIVKIR